MGEEGAGISAVETAAARIRSGQSTHVLVGGAFQTQHSDMLLAYELGGYLHRGSWKSVWDRKGSEGGGVITGSGAAFLVLELREHAELRQRNVYAAIGPVASARNSRTDGSCSCKRHQPSLSAGTGARRRNLLVLSGASGAHPGDSCRTSCTRGSRLYGWARRNLRHWASEGGAVSVRYRTGRARNPGTVREYPPFDPANETDLNDVPEAVLATAIGYHRFEGAALVSVA